MHSQESSGDDSDSSTHLSGRSPESPNVPTSMSSPSKISNNFPKKDLPPSTVEQTPTRFLAACSKLDLEPNPFEQSFSGVAPISDSIGTNSPKPSLPPVSQIASPSIPSEEYGWNLQSLRSGALSPSMLTGPQETIMFDALSQTGRTGTTPISFGSFPEPSPRSAAIFSASAGTLSTSYMNSAVLSMSTSANSNGPFSRVFAQGVSRPIADTERKTIAANSANTVSAISTTQPGVIQSGVSTLSTTNLLNISNGTTIPASSANVIVPNSLGHQVLVSNSTLNNNRSMLGASQQDMINRGGAIISEAIIPKTEKDDFTNNVMTNLHNGRHSNGIDSNIPTRKSSILSDSMDEDYQQPHKMNSPGSIKSGSRSARRRADEALISEQPPTKKNGQKVKNEMTDEEKRRNFLERNRQAALKCRQRKKQWLANLQAKVEYLTNDNENLQSQAQSYREEIINLKTLLLAHKDCPIAQANGVMGLDSIPPTSQGMPPNINGMNIGPNGVPVGIIPGVSNSGMPMSNVQIPPHMSNHVNGPPGPGMMRY